MNQLGDIATLFNGYSFRQSGLITSEGEIAVVQMKDIPEHCREATTVQGFTNLEGIHQRHFLREGDLLLMARGSRTDAIRYVHNYPLTVASASFYVIRPHPPVIDAAYLQWYLNSPQTQTLLECGQERGSTVAALPVRVLHELPICVPPIIQQRAIGQLARLMANEYDLTVRLARKRQEVLNFQLEQRIIQSAERPANTYE